MASTAAAAPNAVATRNNRVARETRSATKAPDLKDPRLASEHEISDVVHAQGAHALHFLAADTRALFLLELQHCDSTSTLDPHLDDREQPFGTDPGLGLMEMVRHLLGLRDDARGPAGRESRNPPRHGRGRGWIELNLVRRRAEAPSKLLPEEILDSLIERALDLTELRRRRRAGVDKMPRDLVDYQLLDSNLAKIE